MGNQAGVNSKRRNSTLNTRRDICIVEASQQIQVRPYLCVVRHDMNEAGARIERDRLGPHIVKNRLEKKKLKRGRRSNNNLNLSEHAIC